MKRIMSNNLIQKIIIGICIVVSFNFVTPTYAKADFGGVLMGPLIDLVSGIGDAVLAALQYFMFDGNVTAGNTAGGAISGVVKIINPFDSFLVDSKDFNAQDYGIQPEAGDTVDVEINADDLDHGWLGWAGFGDYGIPVIKYTPEKIFSNQVPALNVNFINPKVYTTEDYPGYTQEQIDAMNDKSITQALQQTIASWYNALRNLAVVGLLSVLLYVGIRIIMSSATTDRAKYKQMLMDWAIALCVLFFLHYVMSFTLTLTETITEGLAVGDKVTIKVNDSDGDVTFNTDLTGLVRMQVQHKDLSVRIVYLIFYIALVVYTVKFTWSYVKRAITMAFLTLIAPVVALTYPIDKMNDGSAQAFNFWLKEYVFNALLQPFHLIMYSIFLGSAMEIAIKNPIYAILFLAFITPAEKILRKMFGFDKSSTATAAFGGALGGAAAFNILNKGVNALTKGKAGSSSGGTGNGKIKTKEPLKEKNAMGEDVSSFANARLVSGNDSNDASANTNNNQGPEDNWDNNEIYMGGLTASTPSANATRAINTNTANASANNPLSASESNTGMIGGIRQKADNMRQSASDIYNRAATGINNKLDGMGTRGRVIRGVANVATKPLKYTTGKLHDRLLTKEGWKQNVRTAGRVTARGISAATVGAIGVGMGIAGDDLEDVFTFGGAGAALGGTMLGGAVANAGGKVAHSANVAFQQGYYGDEDIAALEMQETEWRKESDNRDFFADKFEAKGKDLDQVMERASFYHRNGVTDNKQIAQAMKLEDSIRKEIDANKNLNINEEEKGRIAKEQATTIAKIADNYTTEKLRTDEKYQEGVKNDFRNSLKKINPKITEKEQKAQSEQMMTLLKKYKKID